MLSGWWQSRLRPRNLRGISYQSFRHGRGEPRPPMAARAHHVTRQRNSMIVGGDNVCLGRGQNSNFDAKSTLWKNRGEGLGVLRDLFRARFSGCHQLSIESSFACFRLCWLYVIMVKHLVEYVQTPFCLARFYREDLEGRLISYPMGCEVSEVSDHINSLSQR